MEKKLTKIGFNGRPFCQQGIRGLSRHTLELIRALKAQHPELEVFVYCYDAVSPTYKRELPWVHFRDRKIRPKLLWDLFTLGRDVKRDGLELFHSTNNLGVPFLPLRKLPLFTTIHDAFTHEARFPWRSLRECWSWVNYRVELFLLRRSSWFFTVSESAKHDIAAQLGLPLDRIAVAYNGSSLTAPTSTHGPGGDYLYVGGFEDRKNILVMLEGFLSFAQGSQHRLILAGSLDQAPASVKDLIQRHPDRFVTRSRFSDAELIQFYLESRALIFPSLREGFGLPLVEAMGLGCPAIVSDIPVFREIAKDAALYFNPSDPQDLRRQLEFFELNESRRSEVILSGIERARHFNWDQMARVVYETYLKFL